MKKVFIFTHTSKVLPISGEICSKYDKFELYVPQTALVQTSGEGYAFKTLDSIGPIDADIVLTTEPLPMEFVSQLKYNSVVIGSLDPYWNVPSIEALAARQITTFALDLIVRSTKAQYMDVMSSQANLAGYRAVIEGAFYLNRSIPFMITTAGTLSAAKVLVIGAGVAGLQAIATAKRLGANVYAFDVRPITKEQVESLGAKFINVECGKQMELSEKTITTGANITHQQALADILPSMDIVITTAQIPNKPAPIILTKELLSLMKKDSVVIDITTRHGGNCEYYNEAPNEKTQILKYDNILNNTHKSATMVYAKNVYNFMKYLEQFSLDSLDDVTDEIIKSTLLTYKGKILRSL